MYCLGYPHGKKPYKLYDLTTRRVSFSRDVKFYEDHFPFLNTPTLPHVSVDEAIFLSPSLPYIDDYNPPFHLLTKLILLHHQILTVKMLLPLIPLFPDLLEPEFYL